MTKIEMKTTYVRCETCGHQQMVTGVSCLARGWPECCGHTMTWLATADDVRRAVDRGGDVMDEDDFPTGWVPTARLSLAYLRRVYGRAEAAGEDGAGYPRCVETLVRQIWDHRAELARLRAALRAEVERLRAIVAAAVELRAHVPHIGWTATSSETQALCDAFDAAMREGEEKA